MTYLEKLPLLLITAILIYFVISFWLVCVKNNYKNKLLSRPYVKKNRIVISLTTSPERIGKIKPMVDSIMANSILPDKIYLNLPFVFKRNNTTFESIPSFLLVNPLVYINFCEDIGPITKVLPTATLETDPETIIISVDDDVFYHEDFIKENLVYMDEFPNSVITGRGFFTGKDIGHNLPAYDSYFLEGFSGVAYRQKYLANFDTTLFNELSKNCYLSDDLMLSNHILNQNIEIISIGHYATWLFEKSYPFDYGLKSDALHYDSNIDPHFKKYSLSAQELLDKGLLNDKLKVKSFPLRVVSCFYTQFLIILILVVCIFLVGYNIFHL